MPCNSLPCHLEIIQHNSFFGKSLTASQRLGNINDSRGVELATGWVTLSWCHKRIPADFRMMLPQYVSKPVCYFYLGAVMYHMVCFYPSCQLCLQPQHCLLYLKCLRHGTLILDGREACRISFGWTAKAVEDILHASNISRSDMGCSREHVSCPTLKHLPPGQECKREADARDCFDDE